MNIDRIDSWMDRILAKALTYFYKDNIILLQDIADIMHRVNPFKYGGKKTYYPRFSDFLSGVVCGLNTYKRWIEHHPVLNFYQVPYDNGDEFSFHLQNRVTFQRALLANTKFDQPDPILCDYGHIYSEQGDSLLDLALQIRFTKE